LLERSNLNDKIKQNIAKCKPKQSSSVEKGFLKNAHAPRRFQHKEPSRNTAAAVARAATLEDEELPPLQPYQAQFSAVTEGGDDQEENQESYSGHKDESKALKSTSGKTPRLAEGGSHSNIQRVNGMLQKMLKDCDGSIDYKEMDAEIMLKKKAKEKEDVERTKKVRKAHVDNTKLNYEYKARMYYNRVAQEIESYHERSEKWSQAVDELMLIQQEDQLVPRHIPPEERVKIKPYQQQLPETSSEDTATPYGPTYSKSQSAKGSTMRIQEHGSFGDAVARQLVREHVDMERSEDMFSVISNWTPADFKQLLLKHRRQENNLERYINVANIVDQDAHSELMRPEELETLKADVLEVN
jgi:hypothetical protein